MVEVKKTTIDDVSLEDYDALGYPILFTNQNIRKMLKFADVGKNDIFYDLGSGWGQNLIIALTEFNIKKAVGIEQEEDRCKIANERLRNRRIQSSRGFVACGDFEDLFYGKMKKANLKEATVVFYGLDTSDGVFSKIRKKLRPGCKLVYYNRCLFPEIVADDVDYPFYMSVSFKRPDTEREWLESIIRKERPSTTKELWQELRHDYDVEGLRDEVKKYKDRLEQILRKSRR